MAVPLSLLRQPEKMVSEVLILGGGLAGGAAASLLAREGVAVRLLERETEPHHKVCGEFLSIEAQNDLRHIGLDPAQLGAVDIDRIRLSHGNKCVEAPLPFRAQGLSRERLDEALLELAAREGAQIDRGVRVASLQAGEVSTSAGPCPADRLVLATGKRDIRPVSRNPDRNVRPFVGFKMHFRADPHAARELAGIIDLVLFDGGYAGIQLVGPRTINLCLIVRKNRLTECGGDWDSLFGSLLEEPGFTRRLNNATPLFSRPLTIANLPYGYVCDPTEREIPGLFRIGDQAAMTASLSGDGMAIALRTARAIAAYLRDGSPPEAYHRHVVRMTSGQVRRAMALQRATQSPLALKACMAMLGIWPGLLGRFAAQTRLGAL